MKIPLSRAPDVLYLSAAALLYSTNCYYYPSIHPPILPSINWSNSSLCPSSLLNFVFVSSHAGASGKKLQSPFSWFSSSQPIRLAIGDLRRRSHLTLVRNALSHYDLRFVHPSTHQHQPVYTVSHSVPSSRPLSIMMRSHEGYWDPQTSTVDWCESNYTVTRYCAEAINASTNILFLYLGLKGIAKYRHDPILLISYIGYLTVGIGSFLFHATLKCELDLIAMTWRWLS